jgi:spore coat protein U-like protein
MNKFIKSTLATGALVALGSVNAATVTPAPTFVVSANVPSLCRATAAPLNFNTYTPEGGDVVRCTTGTTFNVGLNAGAAPGATLTTRAMVNGANQLAYSLFRDAARTQNWGVTIGTDTQAGVGAGIAPANAVSVPVYGRIVDSVANQNVPAGNYTDTITVTVTF